MAVAESGGPGANMPQSWSSPDAKATGRNEGATDRWILELGNDQTTPISKTVTTITLMMASPATERSSRSWMEPMERHARGNPGSALEPAMNPP